MGGAGRLGSTEAPARFGAVGDACKGQLAAETKGPDSWCSPREWRLADKSTESLRRHCASTAELGGWRERGFVWECVHGGLCWRWREEGA